MLKESITPVSTAMLPGYYNVAVMRLRAIGGLSAFMYFLTVSLECPVLGRSREWTSPFVSPSAPLFT